ncbi:hypothetical protein IJG04_01890 [Candidatus Saccharibacteria bacterium]|nr:hypothetical protein [Candidatus Saccharibacteria bacterium]
MDEQPDSDSLYDSNSLVEQEKGATKLGLGVGGVGTMGALKGKDKGVVDNVGLAKGAEEGVAPLGNKASGLFTGNGKPSNEIAGANGKSGGLMGRFGFGRRGSGKKSAGKGGMLKKKPTVAIVVLLAIGVIGIVVVGVLGSPMYMISAIDYGLQDSSGITPTVAVLEEQGEYVTAEQMAKGRVNSEYANRLAMNNIEVGQVTASGDFVRTNTYIANLDELDEVAVVEGDYRKVGGDGELVILFKNEIITAGEFVAAVESDPELQESYSESANLSGLYYYSNEVNDVYQNDLGISRGNFNSWQQTGDYEADQESYDQLVVSMLDNASNVTANGGGNIKECGDDEEDCDEWGTYALSTSGDGASIVDSVADIKSTDATDRAAALLNVAVSSSEPYLAASAFMAVEEPIQRARIDGDGPVNEAINMISRQTEVTYSDCETGEDVTVTRSILDTYNFGAAVANSDFSLCEAKSFSRDRVIDFTDTENQEVTGDTVVGDAGKRKSNILVKLFKSDEEVDREVLDNATTSVSVAFSQKNSEVFNSIIGGNRVPEGGAFISGTINKKVLLALPSDDTAVESYHEKTEERLALKAEADRATKNPFDISSPYTFMGSLVRNLGVSMVKMGSSNGLSPLKMTAGTVMGATSDSVDKILVGVYADGSGQDYANTNGDCPTSKSAYGVVADIYCTEHNTIYTGYISNTLEDWKRDLAGEVGSDGEILDNTGLAEALAYGGGRGATVGVESAEVCEAWNDENRSLLGKLKDSILDAVGLFEVCNNVPSEVATSAKYTLSSSNPDNGSMQKYSAYVLYDTVSSLLSGQESQTAIWKKKYYEEHPRDNSRAGVIARRSGMTKAEAEIVLAYADYLTFLANYDASGLYIFGQNIIIDNNKFDFIEASDEKIAMMALVVGRRDVLGVKREAVFSA